MKSDHRARMLDSMKRETPKKDGRRQIRAVEVDHGADRRPTVLLVDDDQEIVDTLATLLGECGFRTISANSVKAAIARLQSAPDVSLILLDILMPEQDGFALLEYTGSNLRFAGIPVVISTVLKSEKMVVRARMMGASDYIVKPYTAEAGLGRILKVLDEAQRRILLVSDDDLVLRLIGRTASSSGHRVLTARTGEQAIATITAHKVDGMVAELVLEDMTGFELMARASDILRWMPTMFISDSVVRIPEKDIIAAGGHGLIERPFSNLEVSRRINQLVRCNNMLIARRTGQTPTDK
jgi:CheY-like chemotaxis protein